MKKTLLALFISLLSGLAFSQTMINESFNGTTFPPTGWTNLEVPTPSTNVWDRVTSGSDPTCNTHSGAGMARYYAYNYANGKSAILATPVIDLSGLGLNVVRISFWMYRDNAWATNYDSLDVYIGTSLTNGMHLGKINRNRGLEPTESADGWYNYSFDIPSSFNGASNYVVFKATSGYGNNIFIDDILIQVPPANDAGVTAITTPNTPVSIGTSAVTATIKNLGSAALTTATIAWSVNGILQAPYTWNGSLASSATSSPVSIGNYNFATTGLFTIKSWTENPNGSADSDNTNDTTTKVVYVQNYTALPFSENFDGTWINKLDTNDVPSLFWINTPATGNQSWRRNDEGTTAGWASTYGSYTPAGEGGTIHSARFHTFDVSEGEAGILDAYLDFSATGEKQLKFWFINTGGSDSLKVLLSTDGGSNFAPQAEYTNASTWQLKQLSLGASTSSTVIVRFMAISDEGGSDIGIDGVQVSILQPTDVGVNSVTNPLSKLCGLVSDSVNVIVSNNGTSSQSNIPVVVNITTPTGNLVLNDTLVGPLASLATDTLFVGFLNTVTPGNYTFKAFTNLTGDNVHSNDTSSTSITINVPVYPYVENFELSTALTNWTTNMYRSSGHGNSSYVLYKNLYTGHLLANATSKNKIGSITSNSFLSFDYRYTNYDSGTAYTLGLDSLIAQVSDDCGATFTTIYVIDSTNHVTSANMRTVSASLSAYAGDDILVKFIAKRGTTGDYYIDIDNINVFDSTTVGVNEYLNNPDINIFPNPTNGITNIVISGISNANLAIYSIQGQMVYTEKLNAATNSKQLYLSYLPKGIYMIRISDEKNNIFRKLILQ